MSRFQDLLCRLMVVLPTAISLGLTGRFLRAIFTVPPPLTIDWTPGVYGLAGFLSSAVALRIARENRSSLSQAGRYLLIVLGGSCFVGYLTLVAYFFWRALSIID